MPLCTMTVNFPHLCYECLKNTNRDRVCFKLQSFRNKHVNQPNRPLKFDILPGLTARRICQCQILHESFRHSPRAADPRLRSTSQAFQGPLLPPSGSSSTVETHLPVCTVGVVATPPPTSAASNPFMGREGGVAVVCVLRGTIRTTFLTITQNKFHFVGNIISITNGFF